MEYAIVTVPAAPVRRKARHQREMVNQLLFGETVSVLKEKRNLWVKVRSLHDDYEGWVTKSMLAEITEQDARAYCEYVADDMINTIGVNGMNMYIPAGSSLPAFENGRGKAGQQEYTFTGTYKRRTEAGRDAVQVKQLTERWLNAPYLWGGRTVLGVDCSGFVQVNFKAMGIDLPRDAWQQAQLGATVNKLKEAQCGDLVFFDDKEEIVHVGILLNNEQIIHASGKVRIDTIDKKGIIHAETGKRTHFLRSIKRYW